MLFSSTIWNGCVYLNIPYQHYLKAASSLRSAVIVHLKGKKKKKTEVRTSGSCGAEINKMEKKTALNPSVLLTHIVARTWKRLCQNNPKVWIYHYKQNQQNKKNTKNHLIIFITLTLAYTMASDQYIMKSFFLTFQSFVFTYFWLLRIRSKQKIEQITKQMKNQQYIMYVSVLLFLGR